MDFQDFIARLSRRLDQPLPGEDAQFLMAPSGRGRLSEIPPETFRPRKSAVMVLLFPSGASVKVVLIQRPSYEGIHGGQVAFPGGRFDETDRDLLHTALRETREEIGIPEEEIQVAGSLSDIYITPSNFLVRPFVGYLPGVPEFRPDQREVESVIVADLLSLSDERIRSVKSIDHSSGYKIKAPYFDVEGFTVWGATAMMISELNAVLRDVISS